VCVHVHQAGHDRLAGDIDGPGAVRHRDASLGTDGRGDSRFLTLTPNLDLTRSVMVARKARGLIFQRITQGYGSMPGFGHKLERGDVEALTELVLAFQKP
jgi:hypothetical protein